MSQRLMRAFLVVLTLSLLPLRGAAQEPCTPSDGSARSASVEGEAFAQAATRACRIADLEREARRLKAEGRPSRYETKRNLGTAMFAAGGVAFVAGALIGLAEVGTHGGADPNWLLASKITLLSGAGLVAGGFTLFTFSYRPNKNLGRVRAIRDEIRELRLQRRPQAMARIQVRAAASGLMLRGTF